MSKVVKKALVLGGGIGGMSAAIALGQQGVEVHLIDIDPDWRALGAGITITGPTLRAFRQLGVLDDIEREGFFFEQIKFFSQAGDFLQAMPTPVLDPGIPPAGAILRPTLHRILSDRTLAEGAKVRLGVELVELAEDSTGVTANLSDGTRDRYDLVIGAEGSNSTLRTRLFPDWLPPAFTGQGCWRLLARRAPEVTCSQIYFGENNVKVGISPCSPDLAYVFATVAMPGNPRIEDGDLIEGMRAILSPFGGHIRQASDAMDAGSAVNYRPLFALLTPPPWHRGRVGLIGDAVHPTTPHLATGAGITVEDALVLAWEMDTADSVDAGWTAFTARRWDRVKLVLENSLAISRIEQAAGPEPEVRRLMGEAAFALAQPI
ncbi:FAD-dependent oxidoreductase [soil metagenome]